MLNNYNNNYFAQFLRQTNCSSHAPASVYKTPPLENCIANKQRTIKTRRIHLHLESEGVVSS